MHPPSASFLGGLRMYKIVLLGEGGVGKSGQFSNVRATITLHRLVAWPKEFTSKHPANIHTRKRFWSFYRNRFLNEFPYSSEVSVIIWIAYGLVYEEFPWEYSKVSRNPKALFVCLFLAPFSLVNYKMLGIPQFCNLFICGKRLHSGREFFVRSLPSPAFWQFLFTLLLFARKTTKSMVQCICTCIIHDQWSETGCVTCAAFGIESQKKKKQYWKKSM